MSIVTTAQRRFRYLGHTLQPQLPTATRLAVTTAPHGLVARLSGGGYSVPSASHPGVSPDARPGRVPVAEHRISDFPDKYTCNLVSHHYSQFCFRFDHHACGGNTGSSVIFRSRLQWISEVDFNRVSVHKRVANAKRLAIGLCNAQPVDYTSVICSLHKRTFAQGRFMRQRGVPSPTP